MEAADDGTTEATIDSIIAMTNQQEIPAEPGDDEEVNVWQVREVMIEQLMDMCVFATREACESRLDECDGNVEAAAELLLLTDVAEAARSRSAAAAASHPPPTTKAAGKGKAKASEEEPVDEELQKALEASRREKEMRNKGGYRPGPQDSPSGAGASSSSGAGSSSYTGAGSSAAHGGGTEGGTSSSDEPMPPSPPSPPLPPPPPAAAEPPAPTLPESAAAALPASPTPHARPRKRAAAAPPETLSAKASSPELKREANRASTPSRWRHHGPVQADRLRAHCAGGERQ